MDLTQQYLEAATAVLNKIMATEKNKIAAAAELLADQVAQEHLIHVFGSGGHSFMGAEEMFYRAGGLVPVNPIFETGVSLPPGARRSTAVERTPGYMPGILQTYPLHPGEVMVIVNAYGVNAATIDTALECKRLGLATIALTSPEIALALPPDHPARHPSRQNLHQVADLYVNTYVPMGDAVLALEGFPQKVAAVSTIATAFVVESIVAETIARLLARGIDPPVWKSGNSPGGDEHNARYIAKYKDAIKHL